MTAPGTRPRLKERREGGIRHRNYFRGARRASFSNPSLRACGILPADLSEKVVRGTTDNAPGRKFNGGTMPIGYVIDAEQHFQIDPLTAPFVLEAFKRYDGGETISSIMNWLNEQGLTNTRGAKMTLNSVGHILHNRRYIRGVPIPGCDRAGRYPRNRTARPL